MTPFDFQLSNAISDERVQEATNRCQFNNTGIWAVRTLPNFGEALNSLAQKLGVESQSKPAPSASHLR